MRREAIVLLHDTPCGTLSESEDGFEFSYLPQYHGMALSLSLPVRPEPFHSQSLMPYFQSLAPEGWLLSRYSQTQRLDENDLFGVLLANGEQLIGAVAIREKQP